ncbi:MAG: hypothetical protein ACXAEX_15305 [Promethearchaeota archaeon]|jgi:hypothetical protein
MTDSAKEAIASFRRWSVAFNARDTDAQLAEMHFPHLRLAQNRFQWWKTSDDFRTVQKEVTRRLENEGWHHTTSLSIIPVQVGEDKVHLTIRQSRQHEDGTEYNGFDTFWIFTMLNGRWGVQFRSSFLTNTQASGYGSLELF